MALPYGLHFVIVVFPDHYHLLLLLNESVVNHISGIFYKKMFNRPTRIVSTYIFFELVMLNHLYLPFVLG